MNNPVLEEIFFCEEGVICEKHIILSEEIAKKYNLDRRVTKEEFKKAGGVINYGG